MLYYTSINQYELPIYEKQQYIEDDLVFQYYSVFINIFYLSSKRLAGWSGGIRHPGFDCSFIIDLTIPLDNEKQINR